jgi:uncharacterized protein
MRLSISLCTVCAVMLVSSAIWTFSNPLAEGTRLLDKNQNGSNKSLNRPPDAKPADWKFSTPGEAAVLPQQEGGVITTKELEAAETEGRNAAKLWEAFRRDDTGLVKLLIEAGVDPNLSDNEDLTVLHHAAANGQVAMTELLLACGSEVNARDLAGYTPLIFAARSGKLEIVKILLEHGADPNIEAEESSGGERPTALKTARLFNQPEVVELLKSHGATR